jgi:dinuclear metal center YbgI/SA1388 family protein
MPATVAHLAEAMEAIAPTRFAAQWDNVGLIVGDPACAVDRVLLTIDCTLAAVDEAKRSGCGAIVSYHPPIFEAVKRLSAGSPAYEAVRAGIAVYSPHTALDVADGGTNDVLADTLGMTKRAPLRALEESHDAHYKLVTFVPAEHVEAVSRAMFQAGAGRIGRYSFCSFRAHGTGTFFGEEGANPVVGRPGRLEEAAEVRLETVVPVADAEAVVHALRSAHPYEEPAFDLVVLASPPLQRGFGRKGTVDRIPLRVLVERIKAALETPHVLVAGDLDREVTRAAVCAGSGGEMVGDAIRARVDLLLTGEVRHHDALRALEAGMAVLCTRHSTSERAALAVLRRRLAELLPHVTFACSREDREPFAFA